MVDPPMVEVGYVQGIIGPESIRVDDAVRLHLLLNDGEQGLCLGIGYDRRIDPSTTLQEPKYRNFYAGATSTFAFAFPAEITFIRLNFAAQPIARELTGDQLAKAHEETDRRVRLDAYDL